ncbi:hypothetical protein ACOJVU_15675 [Mycobacterium sp. THU-M104]|uniref:hypothetical protein n=1 Tax=Mycobacterium sp. THU-M104 TaxID=3410515 RepID=UPI003B9BFD78
MSSKSKRSDKPVQVLGLIHQRGDKRPCGICGVTKRMSQAHVPPRCAGNEMLVKRYRLIANKHVVGSGRQDLGGIYLYGLCKDCNSDAGKYDGAYGHFAEALRPLWVKPWQIEVLPLISTPSITFDPGAVIRSILLGMCATGPIIHQRWPDFPSQLMSGSPLQTPPEIRLYLALARGVSARVAGPMFGQHVRGPHLRRSASGAPLGISAVASVYFPPLAWELVHALETALTQDRWVDVSSWTAFKPGEAHVLHDLVPALPVVCHPRHHPDRDEAWVELLSTEICPIVECANIEGGPPDPLAPTLNERRQVSMDEFGEILRRIPVDVPSGFG